MSIAATTPWIPPRPAPPILKVDPALLPEYMAWFVNRRAYTRQSDTWDRLRDQFWQADSNESRIRSRFREAITMLCTAWPELQASADLRGLVIGPPKHGRQLMPQLKAPKHIEARAERARQAERKAEMDRQDAETKATRDRLVARLLALGPTKSRTPLPAPPANGFGPGLTPIKQILFYR